MHHFKVMIFWQSVKSVAINSDFCPPTPKYYILNTSHDYCFFLLFSPSPATFSGWGINKGREVVLRCKEPRNCFGRILARSLQIGRVASSRELLWNNRLGVYVYLIFFSFLLYKYAILHEVWSFSEVFASSFVFFNLCSLGILPKTNGDFHSKAVSMSERLYLVPSNIRYL